MNELLVIASTASGTDSFIVHTEANNKKRVLHAS